MSRVMLATGSCINLIFPQSLSLVSSLMYNRTNSFECSGLASQSFISWMAGEFTKPTDTECFGTVNIETINKVDFQ